MALISSQFLDLPGSVTRAITPKVTVGLVAPSGVALIAASGSLIVRHDARGVNPPASDRWIIGGYNIFSWEIVCTTANDELGCTLLVEVTDNTTFDFYKACYIRGDGNVNVAYGVVLAGHAARFTLINASAANISSVRGYIKAQGV